MRQSEIKIGFREYIAIVFLIVGSKLTDDIPAILFQTLSNAAWMAPIINGFIILIPIYLLTQVIRQYESKDMLTIIVHLFGKGIGHFALFILWMISIVATITQTAMYTDIIGTMYFPKTPIIIIYAVLMIVSTYGAKKGIGQLGSLAWVTLPYIKVSLFVSLMLSMGYGKLDFIYPIFGPGIFEIVKESTLYLSIYADLLFLFILIPYMKSINVFTKGTWIAMIIIIIELTISILAFLLLFDFESVKLLNYPYHEVIRLLHVGFLTNLELFFLPFWLIASFIRIGVYLYVTCLIFGRIFKIKNFEYVIPTIATIVLFFGLIPETPSFTLFDLRQMTLKVTTPIFFFLPCLLWVRAKLKGDINNETAKVK